MSTRMKLWESSTDRVEQSEIRQHQNWLREGDEISSIAWLPEAPVNYVENILRWAQEFSDAEALVGLDENSPRESLSWAELSGRVGALAQHLWCVGVRPGDTVYTVMPSIPETVIALFAAASVGAVWSPVNTDFGAQGVADRFAQIEPSTLITVDGYDFNGVYRDQTACLAELLELLPTVQHHVFVDSHAAPDAETLDGGVPTTRLSRIVRVPRPPEFERVSFSHPLWVLCSSGTALEDVEVIGTVTRNTSHRLPVERCLSERTPTATRP